jgi:two-component system, sensor histidine kinase and response regulator
MNPTADRSTRREAERWPELKGFDTAAARQCCGDSIPVFEHLLGLLQKNYSTWRVTWIEAAKASAARDTTALCASLHKLRGSASTMGAFHLAQVAEEAESLLLQRRELACDAVQRVGAVLDDLLAHANAWQAATLARRY